MKKKQSILYGVLMSLFLGFVTYYFIYGLKATNVFGFVPFLGTFILSLSQTQVLMISVLVGVIYYSVNYFTKTTASLIAAVGIFILLFWLKDLLPFVWEPIRQLFAG